MTGKLEASAESDLGAARLLQQTRFLVAAFREYDRRLDATGLADEHRLRLALETCVPVRPYRHVMITVADQAAERMGLWPCDFDLLMRLPGLERIDVVATEGLLSSGFHERLHAALPGIEECRVRTGDLEGPQLVGPPRVSGSPAALQTAEAQDRLYFVHRDREDELAETVRRIKTTAPGPLDEVALVFQRPLPYLYLARQLLDAARLPYAATDTLPLAAEPWVAAFDLVTSFVLDGFTRTGALALLGSPHFSWGAERVRFSPATLETLDRELQAAGFLGGSDRLADFAERMEARRGTEAAWRDVARASRAVADAAVRLVPLTEQRPASLQIALLQAFLAEHARWPAAPETLAERYLRAQAALGATLRALGSASEAHGDRRVSLRDFIATLRRWIESRTFALHAGQGGVRLIEPHAARYGWFSRVHVLGLVEGEWPEPGGRSIFYPSGLLRELGWPPDASRTAAARAAFIDLLALARHETSLSAFLLEEDALVRPSVLLEDVDRAALPVVRLGQAPATRVFRFEAMWSRPPVADAVDGDARLWLDLRQSRPDALDPRFHGQAGSYQRDRHTVTAVELYLRCPFKYFAAKVLGLEEERDDTPGLQPLARGRLVHEVFQEFLERWTALGRAAITADTLVEARRVFSEVVESRLVSLSEADRPIERARLLGTGATAGMGERVLMLEVESDVAVRERRLEFDLEGAYAFTGPTGSHFVRLSGVADRIDLLEDGTLRLLDYKTGVAPRLRDAIQLPVYAYCAEQRLAG